MLSQLSRSGFAQARRLPRLAAARAPALARLLSTAPRPAPVDAEEEEWESAFLEATESVSGASNHQESADSLRALVRTGLLRHTDLRDRPERFFKAHRLLARHAVAHGPGFWIRFTVHYNLCFGTVLAVGGPEQVASLDTLQEAGEIGCFALTEKLAGVQSGLVVQTTAEYDAASSEFVLSTPSVGSQKNWISQGFTADRAVVLADLTVGGKRRGPHAFLMELRQGGRLVDGVSVGDMGLKTTGNDLDNAWIALDQVRVPRSALLNAHASVSAQGEYAQCAAGIAPFEMIGQRLYTGRVAVAQASLAYRKKLFEVTKGYADAKPLPNVALGPGAPSLPLSSIPQLKSLYAEAERTAAELETFVVRCEEKLAPLLRTGAAPDAALANAIAVAKVKCVEASIDLCWRLKQEVGSYALMGDSGFAHLDFLSCCKFAEGDSRVLMQKMARDRFKLHLREAAAAAAADAEPAEAYPNAAVGGHSGHRGFRGVPSLSPRTQWGDRKPTPCEEERRLCTLLATALAPAGKDKASQAALWDENWETVYALAEATMDRTMDPVRSEFMRD